MDYSLLKNKVYLTLLAYYDQKKMPSYVELGEKVGISRQTASTRTKELFDEGLIEKSDNKIVVQNKLNIDMLLLKSYLDNNRFDPVELKQLLFEDSEQTKTDLAKELGVSRASIYLDQHTVIYAICSEGKIKYIGTTTHYEDRINQHIKKRPFLTPSNFIVLVDNILGTGYRTELELIHLLQPEWNIMGKSII